MAKSHQDQLTEAHDLINTLLRSLPQNVTIGVIRSVTPKLERVLKGRWYGAPAGETFAMKFLDRTGDQLDIWERRHEHGGVPGQTKLVEVDKEK